MFRFQPLLIRQVFLAATAMLLSGCTSARPVTRPTAAAISVGGTLTDTEAARLAVVNNPAFRELAADLGIAEAELLQASELPNPGLSVLFPLGQKQLEYVAKFPLESLWLRPHRTAVARRNADTIGQRLIQDGLDLIRDVKLACVELRLAERKSELARDEAKLLQRFSDLASARLEAGDISELEVDTAETDALRSRIDRDRSPHAEIMAKEKLRHLLGASNGSANFSLAKAPALPSISQTENVVLERAFAARPDLRAAELAIETEGKRVGLAQNEVFQLIAMFDANGSGSNFEAGPGIDVTLPIFNQNQGAKALADAKFKKATLHYVAVRDQIALDVRYALARYRQSEKDVQRLRSELLPALDQVIDRAERAWQGGEVSYLFVLESSRKVQAARLSEAELLAEWQRAAAELERAVGSPKVANIVSKNLR